MTRRDALNVGPKVKRDLEFKCKRKEWSLLLKLRLNLAKKKKLVCILQSFLASLCAIFSNALPKLSLTSLCAFCSLMYITNFSVVILLPVMTTT